MIVDKMLLLCLLVLVSSVAYVYAAVAIYPYEPKPAEFADQEGCYIKDLNRVLPYNEPYYPKKNGECLKYTCGTNNETQLDSCGSQGYPGNCRLEYDYTLDYPKCCGTLVCDPTTPAATEEPSTEICVTVTEPPCERPIVCDPTTPAITEEPSTETCVTVTEPPCERPIVCDPNTPATTEEPSTETGETVTEPPCGRPIVCDPNTPATTEEPSTETCVTVTEPPCERPRPVSRSRKIPGGKKYKLPVEPDC